MHRMTTGEMIQAIVRGVDDPKAIDGWDVFDPEQVNFTYRGDNFAYYPNGDLTRMKDKGRVSDEVTRALQESLEPHTPYAEPAPGPR